MSAVAHIHDVLNFINVSLVILFLAVMLGL